MSISNKKPINLFYWSSVLFEKKEKENYGDLLSKYIVEKVSGKPVRFYNAPKKRKAFFQQQHVLAIGSIMSYTSKKANVWGSGIISRKDNFPNANFCAVRGPESRKRILELGYECPEMYGDPALLLPKYYAPTVKKKYTLGIIPHYVDYPKVSEHFKGDKTVKVINLLTNDVEATTREILSCKQVISSSLHGVVVSHAYQIPALWIKFSDKLSGDNVKFYDYYASVGIDFNKEICILPDESSTAQLIKLLDEHRAFTLAKKEMVEARQQDLEESFPF